MAARKQKPGKATRAAKPKSTTTPRTTKRNTTAVKTTEAEKGVAIFTPRRSTRLATKTALSSTADRIRKGLGGPYVTMYELSGEIPWTEATAIQKWTLDDYSCAEIADVQFLPGFTNEQFTATFQKIKMLSKDQQMAAFEKAFKAAFAEIFKGTFGYHGPHTSNKPGDHVWFWDQALGCWRRWVISGTGHVDETFHLTAPPEVTTTWETELRKRGHPGLDLRTQPAFHLVDGDDAKETVKVVDMPLIIVADSKHFTNLDPSRDVESETDLECLKTSTVDDNVAEHFRIPVDRIWDPCLTISFKRAMQKRRRGQVFWEPHDPLGFHQYEHKKKANGEAYGPYGSACWDWVHSDFMLSAEDDKYFFQQDGDTYTLTLKKPEALQGKDAAAWHADVPYGPFTAFARQVNATFWPPTPPPVFNSVGIPQATPGSQQSSPTSASITPRSPFVLASVPITRYRSGQAFDADRLSRHAAHFGVQPPALADIATHFNVALPAQPSPDIEPTTMTRTSRRTASAMNNSSNQ